MILPDIESVSAVFSRCPKNLPDPANQPKVKTCRFGFAAGVEDRMVCARFTL
jgi:hypothetical protein